MCKNNVFHHFSETKGQMGPFLSNVGYEWKQKVSNALCLSFLRLKTHTLSLLSWLLPNCFLPHYSVKLWTQSLNSDFHKTTLCWIHSPNILPRKPTLWYVLVFLCNYIVLGYRSQLWRWCNSREQLALLKRVPRTSALPWTTLPPEVRVCYCSHSETNSKERVVLLRIRAS